MVGVADLHTPPARHRHGGDPLSSAPTGVGHSGGKSGGAEELSGATRRNELSAAGAPGVLGDPRAAEATVGAAQVEPVPVEGAALPTGGTGADLGGSPASPFTDALSGPSRSSPGPLGPGAADVDHDACAAASSPSPAPAPGQDGVAVTGGRGTSELPVRRLDEELVKVEASERGGGPPRLDQVLDRAQEACGSVQGMLRPVLGEQARLHAELARSRAALERSHSRPRP